MSALLATGARLATMCVSLVCGVLAARLVIGEAGVEWFALLSLLVALPGLISFSDLGAGAVVVGAIATSSDVRRDEQLIELVTSVVRIMLCFAGAVLVTNLVLGLTGGWTLILGSTGDLPGATAGAVVCLLVWVATVSLGIWQRILLGLRRNHLVILLQGLISPISLLGIWIMLSLGGRGARPFLALGTFIATLVVAVLGLVVAHRSTAPLLRETAGRVFHPRRFRSVRVMDVGWAMFAQILAAPLSLTVPRYILAQTASSNELARYALAGQVFFALQALIGAAGLTLWPAFARARAEGELRRGPAIPSLLFGAGAVGATTITVLIGPWFFGLLSNGQLTVPTELILSFGAMVTLQAVLYPLGMFIMDGPGIRFQVLPSLLSAGSTVGLTVLFAPLLGAPGPLLAFAISVVIAQIVPYALYIRRHRDRLYGRPRESIEAL
ncbi:MAG: hypothetical protein HY996_11105 [Micrococcales bacterium]|nr:hypothetical protein [Micrococcales bacterium]